jgi:hypothetical protein
VEVRKLYQIEISNRFATLEDSSYSEDIYRGWENIRGNIKTLFKEDLGIYELKQHRPWFD